MSAASYGEKEHELKSGRETIKAGSVIEKGRGGRIPIWGG